MKITNKKAKFNYTILEEFEAGIVLTGAEVKAIKSGHASLSLSYAKVIENEMYLINATITVKGVSDYKPTRTRKLLLHKSEISSIKTKIKAKKLTLVPLSMYTTQGSRSKGRKARLIKIKLGLAKSKRSHEKRQALKEKTVKREIERELRGRQ